MTIMITGGSGFLGRALMEELVNYYYKQNIISLSSKDGDLTERDTVNDLMCEYQPDIVIHLAARVGGIGANKDNPGSFFHDNIMMGVNLIEAARDWKVKKFIQIGTVCSYPKFTSVPFKESDLWNGYPEETNAPYGIAKKALLVMLQAYRQQYNFNGIYLLPTNLYGPRDNFSIYSSHVIPAIIKKMAKAKDDGDDSIVLWGDGYVSRDFLYVEDCAKAIRLAMEKYDKPVPLNIGTGCEVKIIDLAKKIAEVIGYTGNITWDVEKPSGQPRRCLNTRETWRALGFSADTSLDDGLRKTIDWYYKEKFNADTVG